MGFTLSDLGTNLPFDDIIDVRSPAEFAQDHLPGAINLPALSDKERAQVGTIYTQKSPFEARKLGAGLVCKNMSVHLENRLHSKPKSWKPLVYCWRGGQRSGSVATILRQIGWQTEVIEGGYKSYRKLVKRLLYDQDLPVRLVLLAGYTGTAKTELLKKVGSAGMPVLDLEGLAGHRGSLFGALPDQQPSQKAFETALASELSRFSPDQPVLVEAESNKIGDRILPPGLWSAMTKAPRIEISAPLTARATYTLSMYRDIADDPGKIRDILRALGPYHSKDRILQWQQMAEAKDFNELTAELLRHHYDPRYQKSCRKRDTRDPVVELASFDGNNLGRAANLIVGHVRSFAVNS